MIELNEVYHGAPTRPYAQRCLNEFTGPLIGVELGIAYGGGVEAIGKLWQGRGTIHGFDTFEGHPRQLAWSQTAHEAYCMEPHYQRWPNEWLTYEYQRQQLDSQGLNNVQLHRGLLQQNSLQGIEQVHYGLIDLDMVTSMILGYTLLRDRVVPGGYLCLHDVLPRGHILGLWGLYQEILAEGLWEVVEETPGHHLAVLRKKR